MPATHERADREQLNLLDRVRGVALVSTISSRFCGPTPPSDILTS